MKRVPSAVIFVMLFVSACTSAQQTQSPAPAVPPPQAMESVAETATDAPAASELQPTDPDVMYHVLAAESLGAEGDFSGAAAEYLEAAMASDDPKIAERAARIAVSAGEWQMVALASDRWAMLQPDSLDARQLAAGSRLKEGDYVGAEYQLAQILELTSNDQANGWSIVANLLAPAKDDVRANKVLNNLLKDFDAGQNANALFARSQLAARAGNTEAAADLVQMAIDLEPGRVEFLAWSGRLAMNRRAYELALQRYRQAWEIDPQEPNLAMAYAELLKHSDKLSAGQEVLAAVPDTPDMRFARVVFSLDAKDKATAEEIYQAYAHTDYADKSAAAFQAAQSAELLGHPRQAIDWYKKVIGEHSSRAVMRQAFLLADLDDITEARKLLAHIRVQADQTAISLSYQAEAQILQQAGRPQEAMQLFDAGLQQLPDDVTLRYNRALLAVELGQLELAESDFRQIIAVEPDNAAALNALGYTLVDLTDRYAEAEPLILKAFSLQPRETSIIDSMGWLAYRLGRFPEAEAYLRQAWARMKNAEIAAHLGEVLWASGQKGAAREVWEKGLQLESDNEILIATMQRFGVSP